MFEKLKRGLQSDQVFLVLVVVLVGIGSFGLGRLSIIATTAEVPSVLNARVIIAPQAAAPIKQVAALSAVSTSTAPVPDNTPDRMVVASRSGTKYYLPNCSGVARIKPENRITFVSPAAARAAGYLPAANCPGVY